MRKATNGFRKTEPPQAPVIKPVPLALNIRAAVEYTGLTNNHIEEALRAGKIRHKMVGSAKYMDRADLDAYWRSLPYVTGNEHFRSLPNDELRSKLFNGIKKFNRRQRLIRAYEYWDAVEKGTEPVPEDKKDIKPADRIRQILRELKSLDAEEVAEATD